MSAPISFNRRDFGLGALAGLIVGIGIAKALPQAGERGSQLIYLVRHAEKQKGTDPSLTPQGLERANALRDMMSGRNIEDVYSTDYARTRETAEPLAAAIGKPVRLYDPSDLDALVSEVSYFGRNVVIVGHSNTTPALAQGFGTPSYGPIDDATEYDRLYEIVRLADGKATSRLSRYP